MSSEQSDLSMLDLLAFNCGELSEALWEAKSEESKNRIVLQYLQRNTTKPIEDYNLDDLDWFNVAEPLSLHGSLKGKIVILDFFTYCCINCMHVLPDLKKLEHIYSIEDGLVVVGVHSAKFENEKDSANILSAVQRYEITHPVVNDSTSTLWMNLKIQCWPTLLILGPHANPLFVVMGEGHFDILERYVRCAVKFYQDKGELKGHKLPINLSTELQASSNLKFPGKIVCSKYNEPSDDDSELYAISDSGNHRILIINGGGDVVFRIGGKESGYKDGDFKTARFNAPQGLAFLDSDTIFVADTENHAIRKIRLTTQQVETVVGTGVQGYDKVGGKLGPQQVISSPWDVVVYQTKDMDMSFHSDESAIPWKNVVLIAMAGTHQIWALFLEDTIWWKYKKYGAGTCAAIAGNGHEENRNNSYPNNAAFAQPSGLALAKDAKELFIADSESSAVRKLSLTDGKVSAVVGGDNNPLNLFAFGDFDGKQFFAKLQHPLGVAYNPKENSVYVADTYNHKVKKIDQTTNIVTTCKFFTQNSVNQYQFNEPAGLCVSPNGDILFVADTNNHKIEMISLANTETKTLALNFNSVHNKSGADDADCGEPRVSFEKLKLKPQGGKVKLTLIVNLERGVKCTEEAPQKWQLQLPANELWHASPGVSGALPKNRHLDLDITVPSERDNKANTENLVVTFKLNLCAGDVCFPKGFAVNFPIGFDRTTGQDCIVEDVNVYVNRHNVKI